MKWFSLVIAIIALALSGFAIYLDNSHYQEVTKPHTEHAEINDKLNRLDSEIERVRQDVFVWRDSGEDTSSYEESLSKANDLRRQADEAWREKQYDKATNLINQAYQAVYEIIPPILPEPSPGINWGFIGGLIAAVVIIGGALTYFLWWRRRYEEKE